ncbi:MAG: T9SS type A sorting domain-containing protein [Saprospiraceae bacterium]
MNQLLRLSVLPLLLLACLSGARAQNPCVTFDSLPAGKNFNFGLTAVFEMPVLSERNFRVLITPLPGGLLPDNARGTVVDAKSLGDKFPRATGNAFQMQHTALNFVWGDAGQKVVSLCFDLYVGEGVKVFSVNGLPAVASRNISDLNGLSQVLTGVKAKVTFEPASNGRIARVCMEGAISRFSVGGEDLIVDNFCFQTKTVEPVCSITELKAADVVCDSAKTSYSATLSWKALNAGDSLVIESESGFRRVVSSSLSSIRLTNIPVGRNLEAVTLYLCARKPGAASCCQKIQFALPCAPPATCKLSEFRVFDLKCGANGTTYSAWVKLAAKSSSDTLVGKTSQGFRFSFRVSDKPVLIEGLPLPPDGIDFITICDPLKPDCCTELRFKTPCQTSCTLGPIAAEQVCLPNGTFMVKLKFTRENAGQQFKVTANGAVYGIFSYEKLPIQIGPFTRPSSGVVELKVQDLTKNCSTSARLAVEPCGTSCNFNSLKAEVLACEGGKFYAGISFQAPQADSSRTFALFVNGKLYGKYGYLQNPLRIGPLAANGVTLYSFLLVDGSNPSCNAFTTIKPVICAGDTCKISNLTVKALGCNPDGSQRILVDFKRDGLAGETFGLFMGNGFIGNFPLSKLPIELSVRKPLLPASSPAVEFSVCIRGPQNCCASVKAELKDCPLPCREPAVVLDRKDCAADTTFSVVLKAGVEADSNFTYFIFLNEKPLDTLRPSRDSIAIAKLKGDGKTVYTIQAVSVVGGIRCVKTMKVGPVNCLGPETTSVWPGDANQDNAVNFIDLLNIGVAYGAKGPLRTDRSGIWKQTPAADWSQRFATGQNFKHADTDGDGVVDEADIALLKKNYGKKNGIQVQAAEQLPGTSLNPGVMLEMPTSPLPATGTFEIPITLGTREKPVRNVYGMAFVLKVDPRVVDLNKVEIVVPMSWMGRPGVNLASISKVYPEQGLIEVSITRTDQNEVSGFGEIAFLKGGIKDDIAGRHRASEMIVSEAGAARLSQEGIPLSGSTAGFEVAQADSPQTPVSEEAVRAGTRIFPNPLSGDQLGVRHLSGYPIEEIQVFGIDGKPASPLFLQTNEVNLSGLPGGLYIVRIKVNGFTVHEKLIRQ